MVKTFDGNALEISEALYKIHTTFHNAGMKSEATAAFETYKAFYAVHRTQIEYELENPAPFSL